MKSFTLVAIVATVASVATAHPDPQQQQQQGGGQQQQQQGVLPFVPGVGYYPGSRWDMCNLRCSYRGSYQDCMHGC
ncbi:hypothetical protein FB639_005208, partial [Coemansia asiatica]